MGSRLHSLLLVSAHRQPERLALLDGGRPVTYGVLALRVEAVARGLVALGLQPGERMAVWLPKSPEAVIAMFGASMAGGVFVPVHQGLKPAQVAHVLADSGATLLVTSAVRLAQLATLLGSVPSLTTVLLVDGPPVELLPLLPARVRVLPFAQTEVERAPELPTVAADALAALFYTSGSTGRPKGVMLSHLNLCVGAASVSQYLGNTRDDRILAVLPFSFDYGFSQLSTGFLSGACVVMMDYLLPRDVVQAVDGAAVDDLQALNYRIATHPPGARVRLTVVSGKASREVMATVALPPETPARETLTLRGRSPFSGATVVNLSPAVMEELSIESFREGVVIEDVAAGSTAANVGLQKGDVILAVNDAKIARTSDLQRAGETRRNWWKLTLGRGGQIITTAIGG